MNFSYDTRSRCLQVNDKHDIYHKPGTHIFYYKDHGKMITLTDDEIVDLKRSAKWFIENRSADFGPELNEFFLN